MCKIDTVGKDAGLESTKHGNLTSYRRKYFAIWLLSVLGSASLTFLMVKRTQYSLSDGSHVSTFDINGFYNGLVYLVVYLAFRSLGLKGNYLTTALVTLWELMMMSSWFLNII
jgi:hypothetical protein